LVARQRRGLTGASHAAKESAMNWTQIENKWDQIKNDAKAEWGRLTETDLQTIRGNRDQLVGKIVERYGVLKANAQRDVEEWTQRMHTKLDAIRRPHDRG
jgi:uncharacterized protein YjbJ (UPF0337 family)